EEGRRQGQDQAADDGGGQVLVVADLADEGQGGVHGGGAVDADAAVGKVAAQQEYHRQSDQLAHQVGEQGDAAVGVTQVLSGQGAGQAEPAEAGAQRQRHGQDRKSGV